MKTLAIVAYIASAVVGAIQTASPAALGLPPLTAQWLGVAAVVLSTIQAILPEVHRVEPTKIRRPKPIG